MSSRSTSRTAIVSVTLALFLTAVAGTVGGMSLKGQLIPCGVLPWDPCSGKPSAGTTTVSAAPAVASPADAGSPMSSKPGDVTTNVLTTTQSPVVAGTNDGATTPVPCTLSIGGVQLNPAVPQWVGTAPLTVAFNGTCDGAWLQSTIVPATPTPAPGAAWNWVNGDALAPTVAQTINNITATLAADSSSLTMVSAGNENQAVAISVEQPDDSWVYYAFVDSTLNIAPDPLTSLVQGGTAQTILTTGQYRNLRLTSPQGNTSPLAALAANASTTINGLTVRVVTLDPAQIHATLQLSADNTAANGQATLAFLDAGGNVIQSRPFQVGTQASSSSASSTTTSSSSASSTATSAAGPTQACLSALNLVQIAIRHAQSLCPAPTAN